MSAQSGGKFSAGSAIPKRYVRAARINLACRDGRWMDRVIWVLLLGWFIPGSLVWGGWYAFCFDTGGGNGYAWRPWIIVGWVSAAIHALGLIVLVLFGLLEWRAKRCLARLRDRPDLRVAHREQFSREREAEKIVLEALR